MAPRNLAYRIGGDASGFVSAQKEAGDSAEAMTARAEAALARYNRQLDAANANVRKAALAVAVTQPSPVAQQVNAAAGTYGGLHPSFAFDQDLQSKSARESAEAFAAAMAAEERQALALKDALNPLGAAQRAFGAATADADNLLKRGLITQAEHVAALGLAQKGLSEAEKAARSMAGGYAVNSVQVAEFGAVIHHTIDALAAGMPISRVATMEGARLGVAFGSGPGGVAGIFKLLLSPQALVVEGLLAVTAATIGAVAAGSSMAAEEGKLADKLSYLAGAGGATVAQIRAIGAAQAAAGDNSAKANRDAATTLAVLGQVSSANLGPATDLAEHLAAALGVDLASASKTLAQDLADPAKGAAELNAQLHFLTAAQIDHIQTLVDQGEKEKAVAELIRLTAADVDDATEKMNFLARAAHWVHGEYDGLSDGLGEFLRKLLSIPSGDAAKELVEAQSKLAQLRALAASASGLDLSGEINKQLGRIYEAQTKLEAAKQRGDAAAASTASGQLKAAFSGLDPQADQIKKKLADITQLQAALDDKSGKKLADAGITRGQASDAIAEGQREIKKLQDRADGRDKHTESLAREAAAMDLNARSALDVAAAYLQSDAAGNLAEARRKALTDATKKGIDVEAQARRQIALAIGDEAVAGAKNLALLSLRTYSQAQLNDKVAAGQITSLQAGQQLAIENQLMPLNIAYSEASGRAKTLLKEIIDKTRLSLEQSNATQARANLLAANENVQDRVAGLKLQIQYAGDLTGTYERLAAIQKVEQSKDFKESGDDLAGQRARLLAVFGAIEESDAQRAARQTQSNAQMKRGLGDQLTLTQAEISLVGTNADQRQLILERLQRELALKAEGKDLSSAEVQAILAQGDAVDLVNLHLQHLNDNWNEFKSTGEKIVDDVLNPANWKNWHDLGSAVIQDIEQEFIKLSLINPLKNAMFGSNLPTGSGFGSFLSSLFGGGGGSAAGSGGYVSDLGTVQLGLPGYATGTSSAPGGWSITGEDGPELQYVDPGTRIFSAGKTRQMLSAPGSGGATHVSITNIINGQGAGPREVDVLSARLDRLQRELPGTIVSTVNDARSRGRVAA